MFGGKYKLDNVIAFVDRNDLQTQYRGHHAARTTGAEVGSFRLAYVCAGSCGVINEQRRDAREKQAVEERSQ
jgi:hypothetical protein